MPTSSDVLPPPSIPVFSTSRVLALIEQIEAASAAQQASRRSAQSSEAVSRLRLESIQLIAAFPSGRRDTSEIEAVCRLVETVITAGWVDAPAGDEVLAEAESATQQGWNGVLVALLFAPAWQIPSLPTFEGSPLFLWPVLASAYFRLPPFVLFPGHADAIASHQILRLGELVPAAEANPGSAAIRSAALRLEAAGDCSLLRASSVPLGDLLILRGRLRAAFVRGAVDRPVAAPRTGRLLRVGVIFNSLAEDRVFRSLAPWFAHLDSFRFEVLVYSCGPIDPAVDAYLGTRGLVRTELPEKLEERVGRLRNEVLDCALFATRATAPSDPISEILIRRVAPIQAAFDASDLTSGLPNADAVLVEGLADAAVRAARFAERLIALPRVGVRLVSDLKAAPAERVWTRESLRIPEDAVVFASLAPFSLLSPEWADRVAQILHQVAGSRLVIHSGEAEDAGAPGMARLGAVVMPAMGRHGIEASRLILSTEPLAGIAEKVTLLGVVDILLDSHPASDLEGCRIAFAASRPVVTVRPASGFPRDTADSVSRLGRDDCVADDGDSFVDAAVRFAQDSGRRLSLRQSWLATLASPGVYHDPVIFGSVVGEALEVAFDSAIGGGWSPGAPLLVEGSADPEAGLAEADILAESALFAEALPLIESVLAADPLRLRVRERFYETLVAAGHFSRASDGLEAIGRAGEASAEIWIQLAKCRQGQGRPKEAVEAIKRSLALKPRNLDAWSVLSALAIAGGAYGIAEEISQVMAGISAGPTEPAVAAPLGRSLYFSPVGRNGKAFLARILERFPRDRFDFLVIAYDDTDFSDLGPGIEVIRDKGQKWRLVKKHLTPERVAGYEFVFIWDDDIDPNDFDPAAFLEILRRNRLDIGQPSLTGDSVSFHPITVTREGAVGRQTNFVEIMCPAYSTRVWPAIYRYIDPDVNEWGWGYDLIPVGRKGIIDCMSVRHTRPGQSGQAGAQTQFHDWCRKYRVSRPAFVDLQNLS